jgi:hypothetical protein
MTIIIQKILEDGNTILRTCKQLLQYARNDQLNIILTFYTSLYKSLHFIQILRDTVIHSLELNLLHVLIIKGN